MTERELKILHYQNRIDLLISKGETVNYRLIQKARRHLRQLVKPF